jgi:hypothetical protein
MALRTSRNVGTGARLWLRRRSRSAAVWDEIPPVPSVIRVSVASWWLTTWSSAVGQKSVSKPSAPARIAAVKAPIVSSERAAPNRVLVPGPMPR